MAKQDHDPKTRSGVPSGLRREGTDYTDERRGTYDPVSKDGLPQPFQVRDETSPHQKAQWGADVRADPEPGVEPVLPEGLVRPAQGPLNRRTGRRKTD